MLNIIQKKNKENETRRPKREKKNKHYVPNVSKKNANKNNNYNNNINNNTCKAQRLMTR